VEQTTGPLTYAKVAGYPTPTLRNSPRRKIQLDGMKAISKTTPTTSDKCSRQTTVSTLHNSEQPGTSTAPTPTEVGRRSEASNILHDSARPSSQLNKTPANLVKIQSDNRPEDSDNMATEENSLGIEDKNPQESHEMASEEELSSGDEDTKSYFERSMGSFFKGDFMTDDYREEILEKYYKPTCSLLTMARLHGAKKILEKRMKMDAEMIPEDTDINGKEAMQVISSYRFSEEQYQILCLLAGHKMATATKKMALYFKKNDK